MELLRLLNVKNNFDFMVGDKLRVDLKELGSFTATLQRVDDEECMTYLTFMFDDCIGSHCMNVTDTNLGGYEISDLKTWLEEVIFPKFSDDLKEKIQSLTLPTYGQMFGKNTWGERTIGRISDQNDQFFLMKKRSNRIADIYGEGTSYWLKNPTLSMLNPKTFVGVTESGEPAEFPSSLYFGVRPVFTLMVKKEVI